MPAPQKSLLKRWLIPVFVLLPLLAFGMVFFQEGFNEHQFEFGNVREFVGVYHSNPQPILEVKPEYVPEGSSPFILLVGYGKFGADGMMRKIQKEHGELDGKTIKLSGSLIYGDGKTLLELTDQEKSFISIENAAAFEETQTADKQEVTMKGEILDPKCYFGVMKPGRGKIHKSCAINCIRGGIAPVFRSLNEDHTFQYHLILGENGERINEKLLPYVAETVSFSANSRTEQGWNVLYVDPAEIQMSH